MYILQKYSVGSYHPNMPFFFFLGLSAAEASDVVDVSSLLSLEAILVKSSPSALSLDPLPIKPSASCIATAAASAAFL